MDLARLVIREIQIVVYRQFSNFSAISWREQVNFQWDDDEVRFVLDQHAELDFYSARSLKQQSVDRHVTPLGHIILIPSHHSLLFLLNAACLAEKQQIPSLVFGLTRPGLEPMIYRTRGEHTNHYATNAVQCNFRINLECPMGILNYVKGAWVVLWLIHLNLFYYWFVWKAIVDTILLICICLLFIV